MSAIVTFMVDNWLFLNIFKDMEVLLLQNANK